MGRDSSRGPNRREFLAAAGSVMAAGCGFGIPPIPITGPGPLELMEFVQEDPYELRDLDVVLEATSSAFISAQNIYSFSIIDHPQILRLSNGFSPYGVNNTLLRFSGMKDYRDVAVADAELLLPISDLDMQGEGDFSIVVYRTSPWSENFLTWDERQKDGGVDPGAPHKITRRENRPGVVMRINLMGLMYNFNGEGGLRMIEGMFDRPEENYGFYIATHPDIVEPQFRTFCSRRAEQKPKLRFAGRGRGPYI